MSVDASVASITSWSQQGHNAKDKTDTQRVLKRDLLLDVSKSRRLHFCRGNNMLFLKSDGKPIFRFSCVKISLRTFGSQQ